MNRNIMLLVLLSYFFILGKSPSYAFTANTISVYIQKPNDSIYAVYVNGIKEATKNKNYGKGITIAKQMFAYAEEQRDTLQMSKALYQQAFLQLKLPNLIEANSLYGQAITFALRTDDKELLTSLHLNKADLERNLGDYFQAQQTVKKALDYLDKGKDSLEHYKLYNTLGIACNDAQEFDNAQRAYDSGLQYAFSFKERATLLNNMAVNFKEQQNFGEAIKIYQGLLAVPELNEYPETKARIMDNLGFALFKTGDTQAQELMETSLVKRVELEDVHGQFASNIHLADFNLNKDHVKALAHAQQAMRIAKQTKSPDWQLEALQYIIMLKKNSEAEAARYFFLNDSLNRARQKLRNEYISTKFFTVELDKENLTLKKQNAEQALLTEREKTQKWIISGGLIISMAGLGFFFFVYRRNQKQKKEIEKQKTLVEELQRELHHRLKNNLSFIDFFITLAKGKFPDPSYREKLDELQNRINSMFEVHRQLFKKEDVTSVNAKTYISALLENVKNAYDRPNITLEENVENIKLRADISFPIGLIINEFITNSYKYAFHNNERGIISIRLNLDGENYRLNLSDNGKGLPLGFDIDKLDSFGMDTIKLLTKEYKGTFNFSGKDGIRMYITFPI